jgi:hypothetical protein
MKVSSCSGPIIEMSGDFDGMIHTHTFPVLRKPKNLLLSPLAVLDEHQSGVNATNEIVELSFVSCGRVYDQQIGFWVPTGERLFDNLKSTTKRVKELSHICRDYEYQKKEIKNLNNKIIQYEAKLNKMRKDMKKLSGQALEDWLVNHPYFDIEIINVLDGDYHWYTECRLSTNHPHKETVKAEKWELMPLIEFSTGDYALDVKKSVKEAVLKRQEAEKKCREEATEIDRIVKKVAELKAKGIDIDTLVQADGA